MGDSTIISRGEALQILKNDLRKAALEKHAGELTSATVEEGQKTMERIDRDIEDELQRRMRQVEPDSLLY